jgi:hypothetical protein
VSAEKVAWFIGHLQAVAAASPAAGPACSAKVCKTVVNGMNPGRPAATLSMYSATPYDIPPGSQANASLVRHFLAVTAFTERLTEMANEVDIAQYEVMVEGEAHPWAKDTISVAEIRELGKLPADVPVIEQDLREGSERTLTEDDVLRPGKLREGARLTKKRVNFRMG